MTKRKGSSLGNHNTVVARRRDQSGLRIGTNRLLRPHCCCQQSEMGQQLSRPGITRFLDAVKLACFSTAIGLVQYVRWQVNGPACSHSATSVQTIESKLRRVPAVKVAEGRCGIALQLAIAERAEREADERHRRRRHCFGEQQHAPRDKTGGLLGAVPPDVRRAALNLIDYQLTPVLVDQWRYAQRCSCAPCYRCRAHIWGLLWARPWRTGSSLLHGKGGEIV